VPNLWDKTPETPSPSELNPLTNPVLEQNLGRWAKIYFSNPPSKREQAVSQLLEEIKRESLTGGPAETSRPYFGTDPNFQRAVCSACQRQNPPGHKFCSRCGQALNPEQVRATENHASPEAPELVPPGSANDTQWLQDQTFSSLDGSDAPPKRAWKYLVGAAAIVLAGFAYLQLASGPKTKASIIAPQMTAPAALPAEASSPTEAKDRARAIAPASPEHPASPEYKDGDAQKPAVIRETHDRSVVPAGVQAASEKSPLLDARTSRQAGAEGSGAPDLKLAQRYLGGSMGVRDPSVAAKLLWKAVGKQNPTAAILLSDLYLRGDGVPRSCDQARLLLVAAAKRGSPQAAQQLHNLESQGCQ